MTLSRHIVNTRYNITPCNAARLKVGVLLDILANIIPTMFYTVIHIYSDKELLQQIREELETTSVENSSDDTTRTLNIVTMREKCSLLHATFKEVVRHHALDSSVRYVREDVLLDDQYLLRQCMVVQIPMTVLHSDRSA